MKLVFCLALFCATTFSQAALFKFKTTPPGAGSSEAWVVDIATARQWYIAWASSAERVFRFVSPVPNPSQPFTSVNRTISQVVFTGIIALFAAALFSAAKSVLKLVRPVRLQPAARPLT